MPTKLANVDVVLIGMGFTGGILAKELSDAGLRVVGLERGAMRRTDPDFAVPMVRDEPAACAAVGCRSTACRTRAIGPT